MMAIIFGFRPYFSRHIEIWRIGMWALMSHFASSSEAGYFFAAEVEIFSLIQQHHCSESQSHGSSMMIVIAQPSNFLSHDFLKVSSIIGKSIASRLQPDD